MKIRVKCIDTPKILNITLYKWYDVVNEYSLPEFNADSPTYWDKVLWYCK